MSERAESPQPSGPLPIRRLDEALVNRIAAGEIIHRPASALKELIENALDAGSTQIKVTVKDGGLKLLQIVDNGCGIRKSDLPILCERFTTSKLTQFADLQALTTYGFRGEALASISHVAHLSVITKTKDDSCAWRAHYADGALTSAKPGLTADPKPWAGNDGTTITVEDLFYNTPTRLAALRSSSDEYSRILDVVTRYAVHNPSVSFTCKKAGFTSPDVSTPSASSVSANIKMLYGTTVARELLHTTMSSETRSKKERLKGKGKAREDEPQWEAEVYMTNANYYMKKMTLLLFINHRLVESSRIKKAIEEAYSPILNKGFFPFVYLSLQIDPSQVDVNVHPTKREVHFMNEEKIVNDISDAMQQKLASQGESRTFEYQTVLTGGVVSTGASTSRKERDSGKGKRKRDNDGDEYMEDAEGSGLTSAAAESFNTVKKPLPHYKVRTSMTDRTLDSMFVQQNPGEVDPFLDTPADVEESSGNKGKTRAKKDIEEAASSLNSITELRETVLKQKHKALTEVIQSHTFVGLVDLQRTLSLIQHNTKLYLVNYGSLAEEFFYQLALRQFSYFGRLKLQPAPPIYTLIKLAVEAEGDDIKKSGMPAEDVIQTIIALILEHKEMLDAYFSIAINDEEELESIPMLLQDFTPNLDRLPQFLMRLGPQVAWWKEKECFETILRELAYFHRPGPLENFLGESAVASDKMQTESDENTGEDVSAKDKAERWQIQHVLFPAMRKYLVPPKSLLESDVVQVANLPDLYRIFERC
ncbi:DNA mismatch repair protein [Tulasnella sp. 403]|nr:DNA mismatch repair protein [Tulasnella sp. 403]